MREALVSGNVFYQKVEGGENDSGKWKTIIMMAICNVAKAVGI